MSILDDILDHSELTPMQLSAHIDGYELIQPYDCMIDTAKAVVELFAQNYEQAEKWILSALRKNPLAYRNHLYCALIYKAQEKYLGSAKECHIAVRLATQNSAAPSSWNNEVQQIRDILDVVVPKLSKKELEKLAIQINLLYSPGLLFPAYCLYDQNKWTAFQNEFLYFDPERQYNDFICVEAQSYIDGINRSFQEAIGQSEALGACAFAPVESWKAQKTAQYDVNEAGQVFAMAATAPGQIISILPAQGEPVHIQLNQPYIYHYVNMDERGTLRSTQEFILSKGIPFVKNKGRKKQILLVNINSLSQWYLTQTNFASMPYTKSFFEKGTTFQNCYSTSESTFSSESSLLTGLCAVHHHIIYRSSVCQYPAKTATAGELFNQGGYFTSLVSGSVGSSPYIGGLRGFDCAKRKICTGYSDSRLVEDALCRMEGFPDTDQCIVLELFAPHTSVEPQFDGSFSPDLPRQTLLGFHSLYDPLYGPGADDKYQVALKETDRELKKIYDYILSHYKEDEYIICLCSDHGASILDKESYPLKVPVTNTVLMLRGSGVPAGISEEYVNHIDYLPILIKLAGINADLSRHDCVLPRTFGGPGRDYVYTESIYQGQTYKAAVRTDEFECRFEANANTDIDGLIDLSQGYTLRIFSVQTREEIHDAELAEDFEGIVFDHIKENIKY